MVDKNELGTVIDFLPRGIMKLIQERIDPGEDIKAAVKGKKEEALVVTDKGVHIFKASGVHHFFLYGEIDSVRISRVYRRGKLELMLRDMGRYDNAKEHEIFEADSSGNAINFPFAKMAMFKQAEKIISSRLGL